MNAYRVTFRAGSSALTVAYVVEAATESQARVEAYRLASIECPAPVLIAIERVPVRATA